MGTIRILDEHVANLIAAGEVVERPASVVKELVENAIDAGADTIKVVIEEGGLQLIRVTDNGKGIEVDDVPLAFQRHATSKVAESRDLFHIRTLGFRGEALPSIASVARVDVITSTDKSGLGTRCLIEGGRIREIEHTRTTRGTDIQVRDLFFNTPARLKYLKTIQTEFGHISDFLYRIALAHPNISFVLQHHDKQVFRTPGGGELQQTIAAIYGTATARAMMPVQAENADFTLNGWIGRPELTRANRYGMTTIVNGRYVRSYTLQLAITQAYHTLLPINRYPLAVLTLEMDPSLVDVNVHPAKLEVRFSKERELTAFIEAELGKLLRGADLIPRMQAPQPKKPVIQEQLSFYETSAGQHAVDLRSTDRQGEAEAPQQELAGARTYQSDPQQSEFSSEASSGQAIVAASAGDASQAATDDEARVAPHAHTTPGQGSSAEQQRAYASDTRSAPVAADETSITGRDAAYASDLRSAPAATHDRERSASYRQTAAGASSGGRAMPDSGRARPNASAVDWQRYMQVVEPAAAQASQPATGRLPRLRVIGQLHGTYIIAENEEGLYLIDQHAAHERINYEYFYRRFGQPEQVSQDLLVPITLEFTPVEADVLRDRSALFAQIGVIFEPFGGNTFIVRSLPEWMPEHEVTNLLQEIVDWVLQEKTLDVAKLREKSAIMTACKASLKANDFLTREEIESLLHRLGQCASPYTCPHGRPIIVSFSAYELEKMFKRVM